MALDAAEALDAAVAPPLARGATPPWPTVTAADDTMLAKGSSIGGCTRDGNSVENDCRLIFVPEKPGSAPNQIKEQCYQEQGPNGKLVDTLTQKPIVPAPIYANPDKAGAPCVKFDNFEPGPNGRTRVIASKTSSKISVMTSGSTTKPGTFWAAPNVVKGLRSEGIAPEQNSAAWAFYRYLMRSRPPSSKSS